MLKRSLMLMLIAVVAATVAGCSVLEQGHGAKARANASADQAMYKPIEYANSAKPGPALIVIPGSSQSNTNRFKFRSS